MSNFKSIIQNHKESREQSADKASPPSPSPAPKLAKVPAASTPKEEATPAKTRGRPPGKRSDKDFVQVTAYIREETHLAAKIALLQAGSGQEFSELVEELLAKWVKSRT